MALADNSTVVNLAAVLDAAGRGTFPPADGSIVVLPPPPGRAMGVIAFNAHWLIATAAPAAWVREQLPRGDLHAPMSPRFLAALADRLERRDDGLDVVLAAPGLGGKPALRETTGEDSGVAEAAARRGGVRTFTDPAGEARLSIGHGLALRLEIAIVVEPSRRSRGIGARALAEARRLVSPGQPLFAQIAPGNAASLRAFLSAGFRPVGSEILFFEP